jgi:hypothetical protein
VSEDKVWLKPTFAWFFLALDTCHSILMWLFERKKFILRRGQQNGHMGVTESKKSAGK